MKCRRIFLTLWKLLPKEYCLTALLAGLLASLAGILLMGASAWLITSAAYRPPLYTLALGITLVRACGISRAVFRYLERWFSHRAVFNLLSRLRTRIFLLTERLLPDRADSKQQGDFLHALTNGADELRSLYLRALAPLLNTLLLALLAGLFLVFLHPAAALLPIAAWLLTVLTSLMLAPTRSDTAACVQYRTLLLDFRQCLDELQANGSPAWAQQKLDRQASALTAVRSRSSRQTALADTAAAVWNVLAWTGTCWLLLPRAVNASLSLIELAVCLLALQTILTEFRTLPEACQSLWTGLVQAPMLLTEPLQPAPLSSKPAAPPKACTFCLTAHDICFSYDHARPLFHKLSFEIKKGEKIVLPGESGCGKTTLFHLITRLWEPAAGTFFLNDIPYTAQTPAETRRNFAVSTQAGYIFSDSLRSNFRRLYPAIKEAEIWQSLELALLADEIASLPQKLDTPLGEDGSYLSGGQRQRLLLALAFASSAPILLLDEPTAGIDRQTAEKLLENIMHTFAERTILLITHDMELTEKLIAAVPGGRILQLFSRG